MKRIKQRLLSLAMTGALLLGFTLPEAFAASAKSTNEGSASETQETTSKKSSKKQSKKKTTDAQAAEKSSKAKDTSVVEAKSSEDNADNSKSEKEEEKSSSKSGTSAKKTKSSNKAVSLTLSISKPDGLSASGGVWQVDPDVVSTLTLSWKCKGDCDSFKVSVSGGVYSASTKKKTAKIPVSGLSEGKYTATVKAILDGKTVAREKLSFQIIAPSVDETSEVPASESIENDLMDETAIQQLQPDEGILMVGEDTVEAQPDSGEAETYPEQQAVQEALPTEAVKDEPEEKPQEATEEQAIEEPQEATEEQAIEESQDATEGQPAQEAQDKEAEQPVKQAQDDEAEQPVEQVQNDEAEQPVEQAQDDKMEQSVEQARDDEAEQSVEQAQDDEAQQSVEQAQDDETEQPMEQAQDDEAQQSVEQAQDDEADQSVEEARDSSQGQSIDETQDAAEEQSETDNWPENRESELVEETQDSSTDQSEAAPEEPAVDQTQDATQDPSTDGAQEVPGEQPDRDEIDAFVDVLVEEARDASEEPAAEECLDLSEPDIQAPQADAIEIQSVIEEALPDVSVTVLDAPEVQLDEADEALALDVPLYETVLQMGESESITSNAGDEKEKSDNKLTLSIMGAEGLSVIDGAVHVNPAQASAVTLVWSFGGTCDEYAVSVSDGVYDKTTRKSQLKLPVKRLSSGQYTVTVAAKKDGKALSSARLSFIVDAADGEGETAGLAITVTSPQGLLITEGVYQVDPAQAEALTLTWQFGGECDAYDVSISGDVYSGRTEEGTVTVPLSEVAAGTYTVTVVALREGKAVTQAQLSFTVLSQDEKTEGDPGQDGKQGGKPQGGGQRSGGQKGSASKGGDGQEAEQGFRVTPGEALISTHTSGNRDMSLYGAIALTLDAESAMNVLTLGDTALDIRLSDGSLFNASIDGNTLALVPKGEAQAWLLNGYALKTLARSGVTSLRLTLNDMTVEFPTLPELSGSNYGALCAAGRTSRDYSYAISSNGCSVTVAGQTFQLTAEGELV